MTARVSRDSLVWHSKRIIIKLEAMTNLPLDDLVFVGGAPRTGTTILHALICTSPNTNNYVAECGYLTNMLMPYFLGLEGWEIHTKHFFGSHEEFFRYHAAIVSDVVSKIHDQLGRPARLKLKDPIMTRFFHHVAQMLPQARFVVIFRDPRDTIISRLNVTRRLQNGREPSREDIKSACYEYNISYNGIIAHPRILNHRMMVVDYNDITEDKWIPSLENFGIYGIDPAKVWSSDNTQIKDYRTDPWSTDLYGASPSSRSVNRYKSDLDQKIADYIMEQCGWVGQAFGFQNKA
ncbi:sulfotransferase [Methylobacterium sp. J-059]|uniref:sulfotransferase family protein n=1 Tax=Methylobacterium sp. J-059 TaxID=2836643 RepID=UPI001FBA828C|nr:sulfotransferase [Methylobacterium sp. J-059]MCJ2042495.1 sulfotransferase [Methylobacterium sp. J-059]